MDGIQFADRQFLLVGDAPQMEDDRLLDVGEIGGQGLVEGEGAIFVLEGRGDGALAACGNALLRPLDVGAAAGGDDVEDGNGRLGYIPDGIGAADGALRGLDIPEIVDGAVQLHAAAERVLGLNGGQAEREGRQERVCLHPFHFTCKVKYFFVSFARMGPQ